MEKESLDGKHLVITYTISFNKNKFIQTYVLVDTGANGFAFVDKEFVNANNLPLKKLVEER